MTRDLGLPSNLRSFVAALFCVVGAFACSPELNNPVSSPNIQLSVLPAGIAGGKNFTITLTMTTNYNAPSNPLMIEASQDNGLSFAAVGTLNPGSAKKLSNQTYSYNWMVPGTWNSTTVKLRISYTDQYGFFGQTVSPTFVVDSTLPIIGNSGQMRVNGSVATSTITTSLNYIQLSITSKANLTSITQYCFKYNSSTQPAAADPCWTAVPVPANDLNLANVPYTIGFFPGTYTIYAWVKDLVGNISTNTATLGVDMAQVTYTPVAPPTVINVSATSTDAPANPFVPADLTVAQGASLVIKWNASAPAGLSASPIDIFYTTDDKTFTPVIQGVANSAQGGCTIGASQTGCYVWSSSALGGYYRIRVTAKDSNGMIAGGSSVPLNVYHPINFLAGNTDPGIGTSGTASMFMNYMQITNEADPQTLVVTPSGTVYFRDYSRGILVVDPADGVQKMFLPTTGTSSGDGGPVSAATLHMPMKIALDYQNRLLIFDYDRIRRVDLNAVPATIDTFIGGGASSADGVGPRSVSVSPTAYLTWLGIKWAPFFPLPNGDLYFVSDNYGQTPAAGGRVRIYKAALDQVISITPSGTGVNGFPSQDVTQCQLSLLAFSFNPLSSAITSMQSVGAGCPTAVDYRPMSLDPATGVAISPAPPFSSNEFRFKIVARTGDLYDVSRLTGVVRKYDPVANSWTNILGTGSVGICSDGTLATSCPIDINDVFVSAQGVVYFMDRGRVRVIDPATNQVKTILGQPYFFGDSGQPLSARFNVINSLDLLNSGDLVVLDQGEYRFRKFTIGGTIQTIAGNGANGAPNTTGLANAQAIVNTSSGPNWDDFAADPANGNIYYNRGATRIAKLDSATGKWVDLVGGGATPYMSADGLTGANVKIPSYPARILGFNSTSILATMQNFLAPSLTDSFLKIYSIVDGTQTHFAGVTGVSAGTFCADGVNAASCQVPYSYNHTYTRASYDSFASRWVFMAYQTSAVRTMSAGVMATVTTLASAANSFAYRHDASNNIVYYCGVSDGKLHKKNITAATDTAYTWPVPGMSCAGRVLIYNPTRNSLIFPYLQNGLSGVAEYTQP